MKIKNAIKHRQLNNYSQNFIQTTSVSVEDSAAHTVKQVGSLQEQLQC
jgi:hypothetical protein